MRAWLAVAATAALVGCTQPAPPAANTAPPVAELEGMAFQPVAVPPPLSAPAAEAASAQLLSPPPPAPAEAPAESDQPAPQEHLRAYSVEPGDTLRAIAERFDTTLPALLAANDLPDPDLLRIGQELRIPQADPALASARIERAEAAERSEQRAAAAPSMDRSAAALASPSPRRVRDVEPPSISARYVAVLDEESGELLWGIDEHAPVAPASITKIVTTIVAIERADDLHQRVDVTISGSAMAARDGSSIMGIEPGQRVSLMTLLYGMMLPSGNDAAEQVAVSLAGSREEYVAWMNQKVAALGLDNTHFANPSGMDARGHYSSAYDMAVIGRHAMRNATFRQLAAAGSYAAEGFRMGNLNRLIGRYDGADGIKIGFTRAAGRTIVASASHEGHRVFVSLLRSQDLPGDSTAMLNWVWRAFEW